MEKQTVLITGFTLFPGAPENPTQVLIEALQSGEVQFPGGAEIDCLLLPTEYEKSWDLLSECLVHLRPRILIEFGLSAKANGFTLECVARNQFSVGQPDNSGFKPEKSNIDPSSPNMLPSGLPLLAIYESLDSAEIPVEYSDDAGAYVCNHLFYRTMCLPKQLRPELAGFIHVPYLQEQHDRLSKMNLVENDLCVMSERDLFCGVQTILNCTLDHTNS